jgi:hypothetical protein
MRTTTLTLILTAMTTFGLAAHAEEKKAPVNIDGTWTWTYKTRDGQDATAKLRLKQDGDKVTGTYIARAGQEDPVQNGKLVGDQLTFDVTRDVSGQKMKFEYKGKVDGDTITGKITFGRDRPTPHDWEAKRAKE